MCAGAGQWFWVWFGLVITLAIYLETSVWNLVFIIPVSMIFQDWENSCLIKKKNVKIWIAYVLRQLLSNQFKKHSGHISPNCFVMLYYFNFHFCSYLKKNICISCPTSLKCVPETPEWVEGIMGGRGEEADEVPRWFPALLDPTPRPTPSPWASCDLTAPLGPALFQAASLLS